MNIFDVKRRDIASFKEFKDAHVNVNKRIPYNDGKNEGSKKIPYVRTIERHPKFSHDAFDNTYNALEVSKRKK